MQHHWANSIYCNLFANKNLDSSAKSVCLPSPDPPPPPPPHLLSHVLKSAVGQGDAKRAVQDEVLKTLKTQSGFGDQLLEQMAHAHPTPGSANDDSAQR